MNIQFTKQALESFERACAIASERSHSLILPEHLLLAVINLLPIPKQDIGRITIDVNKRLNTIPLTTAEPTHCPQFQKLLSDAKSFQKEFDDRFLSVDHLILALCSAEISSTAFKQLVFDIEQKVRNAKKPSNSFDDKPESSFLTNMVELAKSGKYDPVTGRENEIRSVIEILSKKTKSNPLLIGEPGVGKTAIVTAIARMIANDELPTLKDARILSVDVGALLAGTSMRGDFEKRLQDLLKTGMDKKVILFIDELHMLLNAGGEGIDAANMLKPALASGDLRCIGATTFYEGRKFLERDAAFNRRFVQVRVNAPTVDDSATMLRGLRERLEAFHGTRIRDAAIVSAAKMAARFVPQRNLPDSAIDLLDAACASAVIDVEAEPQEALVLRGKLWSLGLEKASLELDLKRRGVQIPESTEENVFDAHVLNRATSESDSHLNMGLSGFNTPNMSRNLDGSFNSSSNNANLPPDHSRNSTLENPNSHSFLGSQREVSDLLDQLKSVNLRISEVRSLLQPIIDTHDSRKVLLDKRRALQTRIDEATRRYEDAVRAKDSVSAADIHAFVLPALRDELLKLQNVAVPEITSDSIASVIHKWTGIPAKKITANESEKLLMLQKTLSQKIFGQDDAVNTVSNALITARTGLSDPKKPMGAFLFLGPTGVGKTEFAKVLSEEMFNSSCITIDMSEYGTEIAVSKLIGTSAGYVGYDEGGRLTEAVRKNPHTVVLFDEVDLAHPSCVNILYQIIDEGRVCDGKGNEISFRNTIIILTSNMGYTNFISKDVAQQAAISKLGAALFNRIDAVVHFNRLSTQVMNSILNAQLGEINKRLAESALNVRIDTSARLHILKNAISAQFGARPLKKYLQRFLVTPVAKIILGKKEEMVPEIVLVSTDPFGTKDGEYYFSRQPVPSLQPAPSN